MADDNKRTIIHVQVDSTASDPSEEDFARIADVIENTLMAGDETGVSLFVTRSDIHITLERIDSTEDMKLYVISAKKPVQEDLSNRVNAPYVCTVQ